LQITVSPMPESAEGLTPRVRWLGRSRLVASIGDGIFVAAVDTKVGAAPRVATVDLTLDSAVEGIAVVSKLRSRPSVVDMAVSVTDSGGQLAVGYDDGAVRVWTPTADVLHPFHMDQTFTPFDDEDKPLASVTWVGASSLVVGGERNAQLALWTLGDGANDMLGAESVQTLTFASSKDGGDSEGIYNFVCCARPNARLMLLANLRRQSVYAVHFTEDCSGFDYVSEFSATMPILSFTALREPAEEGEAGAGTLQLYCMQTQAIQQV